LSGVVPATWIRGGQSAQDPSLLTLLKELAGKSVAIVAINPNSGDGLRPDELGYSKYDDSFEHMKLYAKDEGFTFPYLYDVIQDNENWEHAEVTLSDITSEGVAELVKNDTSKYRLINVGSTSCVLYIVEFPALVRSSRRMGLRNGASPGLWCMNRG
jgi:hypothetical protein